MRVVSKDLISNGNCHPGTITLNGELFTITVTVLHNRACLQCFDAFERYANKVINARLLNRVLCQYHFIYQCAEVKVNAIIFHYFLPENHLSAS